MKHDMTQSLLLENSLQSTSTVATAYPNAKGDHRADAPLKVTGNARYTADHAWDNLAHAVLVTSPIACGRVASINAEAARRSPGFLGVVSHENCSELRGLPLPEWPVSPEEILRRPDHGASLTFADTRIRYSGQPVAAVVADTLENATAAAHALRIDYETATASVGLSDNELIAQEPVTGEIPGGEPASSERGDATSAFASAPVQVTATYKSMAAHHNPIEAAATIAFWQDNKKLLIQDTNQGPHIIAAALASAFAMEKKDVQVISQFVGGAFGCKLQVWPHGYIAALAARLVNRPVKIVLTRPQMFTGTGHRPELIQHVSLGADQRGILHAIKHEAIVQTGIVDEYVEGCIGRTRTRYACENVSVKTRLAHLNFPAGTSMRAPGKSTGSFALESAMDELACKLEMDPIELRLRNFAEHDPDSGRPWSSTSLKECYRVGAERFGWRSGGRRRGGTEGRLLIGHGMASGSYPRYASKSTAKISLHRSGRAIVSAGISEIGTGNPTVMPRIVGELLGIPASNVELVFGSTDLPFAPQAGGSRIVASVGEAILRACRNLESKLRNHVNADNQSTKVQAIDLLLRTELDQVEGLGEWAPEGNPQYSVESNVAHFCEVAIDPAYETIRVRRFVSAVDVGRVLSPVTARSQILGAVTMGLGQALWEGTHIDHRYARYINTDLGEYLVPVNADVPDIDVHFVGTPDANLGILGAKSAGEIGIVGVAAAVANAIYDACGERPRSLPIQFDSLSQKE
ncbi:xanthine dehydrogenase family protein molybdopterin-binding subunit [Agrobacterium pusense]|uniref:xanthine dehydrogenase family protein molybdopterin-binding subunit n=1 Tax=Agrobacterium pusense TaxID=648995 RepID=UPI0015732FD6|nr:xanthine dehydrogenase family protein molybdopterin-binding subunit [Agrobacterium pusense]NTE48133.1 xanthine dehydrogenase family protein molybdopterin-binding subunit [Agrobacterium pusense]